MTLPGHGIWDFRDMVGRIYVGDHKTLLHTKYNILAVGLMVSEKKIFLSFSLIRL